MQPMLIGVCIVRLHFFLTVGKLIAIADQSCDKLDNTKLHRP